MGQKSNPHIPHLMIIAGTGHNTGKTTLACEIIRKFSRGYPVISLKVTPHIYTDVQTEKVIVNKTGLYIAEETDPSTGKDSSRMLRAGTLKSYFVMAKDEHLGSAFREVEKIVPSGSFLVCESGGLRHHVVPGLFFMSTCPGDQPIKPSSEKLMLLADRIVTFDGEHIDFDVNTLEISGDKWNIKQ